MRACARRLCGPYAEAFGPVAATVLLAIEVKHRGVLAVGQRVGVLTHHAAVVIIDGHGIVAHARGAHHVGRIVPVGERVLEKTSVETAQVGAAVFPTDDASPTRHA